ncbi:MAG: BACON domain-containing protein [Alistipes sp.]|nr:BACON domain-containing protein [Alistipes sp.]
MRTNLFNPKKDENRQIVSGHARHRGRSGLHRRGGGKSVLIETSQLEQTFAAAQTGPKTIAFTALEPWTATLEETTRAGLDWIELDKYEGGAGDTEITITILRENTADRARCAKLTILCGGSRVTILIEQKAAGSDPDDPENPDKPAPATVKYVSRVDYLLIDNCKEETKRETVSQTFKYDERNRVAQIVEEYDLTDKEKGSTLYTLDYTLTGEITVSEHDASDGTLCGKTVALLDEKGRFKEATEITYGSDESARISAEEICSYDSEGRIGKWVSKRSSMDNGNLDSYDENKFFYDAEGLLTRYTYYDSYDNHRFEGEFPAAEFYPNRIANDKTNLDLMFYALAGSSTDLEDPQCLFTLLRLTGGGFGTCLPEKTEGGDDDWATSDIAYDGWPAPNVTVRKSYTYISSTLSEGEHLPLSFTADAEGCITQIAYGQPYAEYLCEYDIVVGSELLHEDMADYPDQYKRYKYEIQNRKTTKQRDIVNPVTISIAYR